MLFCFSSLFIIKKLWRKFGECERPLGTMDKQKPNDYGKEKTALANRGILRAYKPELDVH